MMNIMNPPADWSTMKKLIWLRGTPITGGEELTVSGTPPLSLPNSLGKPLKAWAVDLLPYQEGSGDPAPDNVRPIHGTDKLTITTTGKNLLGINEAYGTVSTITITDGVATGFVAAFTTSHIHIPQYLVGKNLTWSVKVAVPATTTRVYTQVIINGITINGNDVLSGTTGTSTVSFTPTSTSDYFRLTYGSGNSRLTVSEFQLELGSTATPYTPYLTPSQTVLTLPSTVYNGTVGSEGGESRWGEVDLGTLTYSRTTSYGNPFFYCNQTFGAAASVDMLCEIYKASPPIGPSAFGLADNNTIALSAPTGTQLYIRDDRYTTPAEFKTAMSGVKLYYKLATPVQFSITPPTIPTPRGTATTWATAEDGTVDEMSVTYVGKA